MQTIIERELDVQLVLSPERSILIPARLSYRSDDPYAVHITFHVGSDAPVQWTFARELLVEGVFRPAGQGDVRVWPDLPEEQRGGAICLSLRSPDGDALLRIPAHSVAAWLERTMRVVPPGREGRDWDITDELSALLAAPFADARGRSEVEERHDRAAERPGRPELPGLSQVSDLTDLAELPDLGRLSARDRPADLGGLADLADLPERTDLGGRFDDTGEAAG